MEKRLLLFLVVLSAVMVAPTPQHGSAMAELLQSDGFIVPSLVFTTVVTSTISVVSKAVSLVSNFTAAFGDFRLSNALSDCVDLLALSSDQLSWTLSAAQTGESNGTGRILSDMKTWLSAALVNQDTCVDGFEGTNSFVKEQIAGSLSQVTSLVLKAINMLPETPGPEKSNNGGSKGGGRKLLMGGRDESFPSWVIPKDRELLQTAGVRTADVVVAADGTGNFTTVTDAVAAAPDYSTRRFVIYIRRGVYEENVEIKRKKSNIMVFGDGMDATIITGSRSYLDGWTTYRTATFGSGFIARDLTIENTAGPQKQQAVAFRSDSDLSALYRCAFRGYQDTLYAHTNRQFYRECTITGTVDFMFGNAVAVFQSCQILAKKGLPNQKNTVTAQGRKEQEDVSGFSVQFCNITADSDLLQGPANSTYTYLGRPWKQYSRTIFMQSYIGAVVRPEGWLEWSEGMFLDTLFYAEYMNFGPGAAVGSRVQWPGYHVFNGSDQAIKFTVAEFIDGNSWLPQTGVTFSAGLEA
ncbi:hypothetical protein Nepgr_018429 [Nepenthes gracilis]|uniref:Pectinesterase inhibitor domain-containing protein n=1 Tax=Nepenthes gracilis TaxID=150966 RepID=A0AAD3XTE7_NEPGR|nr:hypothetical protein Nepgr_018429 [Nepenthes gracilis]